MFPMLCAVCGPLWAALLVARTVLAFRTTEVIDDASVNLPESEPMPGDDLVFPIEELADVVKRAPAPVLLGKGGWGSAWEVRDATTGRKEIIKLFFRDFKGRKAYHGFLTHADMRKAIKGFMLVKAIELVRQECDLAQRLQARPPEADARARKRSDKGRARLLRCYGHNLDRGDKEDAKTPLYLKLSYNGQDTLEDYLDRRDLKPLITVSWLQNIFKQVAEALQFLQSSKHPVIHHDLKVENIIIWQHTDKQQRKYLTVRVIDFGAMVDTATDDPCDATPCTCEIEPPELDALVKVRKVRDFVVMVVKAVGLSRHRFCLHHNYDVNHPHKFDVYSFGATFVRMITGVNATEASALAYESFCERVAEVCQDKFDEATNAYCRKAQWFCDVGNPFEDLEKVKRKDMIRMVQDPFFLDFLTSPMYRHKFAEPHASVLKQISQDAEGVEYLKLIQRCFSVKPKARPTVRRLLEHAWLRNTQTPLPPVEEEEE